MIQTIRVSLSALGHDSASVKLECKTTSIDSNTNKILNISILVIPDGLLSDCLKKGFLVLFLNINVTRDHVSALSCGLAFLISADIGIFSSSSNTLGHDVFEGTVHQTTIASVVLVLL